MLEVGGPAYLLPTVQRDKLYDIRPIMSRLKYGEEAFIIGAGAGPWPHLSRNCEVRRRFIELRNKTKTLRFQSFSKSRLAHASLRRELTYRQSFTIEPRSEEAHQSKKKSRHLLTKSYNLYTFNYLFVHFEFI